MGPSAFASAARRSATPRRYRSGGRPARHASAAGRERRDQPRVRRSVLDRMRHGESQADRCGLGRALGVAEAAGAHAAGDVVYDVVIAVVVGSATPAGTKSRCRLLRTFHAMLWSAHEASPLTPKPPRSFPCASYSGRPPPKTLVPPMRFPIM